MKIIILRHGQPALPAWPDIAAGDLGEWIGAYQQAAVGTPKPPRKAVEAARECGEIVTSDLPRSIGSARALPGGSRIVSDPVFREVTWPFTPVPLLRLQPYTWAAAFRVLWFLGYCRNCSEPLRSVKERASRAAGLLVSLAEARGCVLLVGHGIMNTFIVRALRKRGWKGPLLPGYGFWSVAEYTK